MEVQLNDYNETFLKQFFWWINERQEIWYKRHVLLQIFPWTNDSLLSNHKFTNVYRELDKTSLWYKHNLVNNINDPKELIWATFLFLTFNNYLLFDWLGEVPKYNEFNISNFMDKLNKYNGNLFTNAYIIPGTNIPTKDKLEAIYNNMDLIWNSYNKNDNAFTWATEVKANVLGIGNFLFYEAFCSLTYSDWFKWVDNDFYNIGNGSKIGLRLVFYGKRDIRNDSEINLKAKFYPKLFEKLVTDSNQLLLQFGYSDFKYLNIENPSDYKNGIRLSNRSVEHSLCEYQKYHAMSNKIGKTQRKYVAKINNDFF